MRKIKIGDKVYFGQGWGVVTEITRPEGFKYLYTVRLLLPSNEEESKVNKEYLTYYVEKDNK